MNTFFFFVLGLAFGSFSLATAWRIKKKMDFVRDTSECEHCHHKLAPKDLLPLFSWLSTSGKCRYCHKKLSRLLPTAELIGGSFFALTYAAWPLPITGFYGYTLFGLWLFALILLLILFFYDLQWYLLPNKLMYPLWVVSAVYAVVSLASDPSWSAVLAVGGAVAVASGLFFLFYVMSQGRWIGFGDVRLGLAIGLFVGTPAKAGLVLFAASIIGLIIALPGLVTRSRQLTSKLAFGPLLIVGLVVTMLYGQSLVDWYVRSILLLS